MLKHNRKKIVLSPMSSTEVRSKNNKKPSISMLASKKEVEQSLNQGEVIYILVLKEDPKVEIVNEDPREEVNMTVEGPIAELLMEFCDVFPNDLPLGFPTIRGIKHHIDLVPGASLPKKVAYHCNPEETKELQKQIDELMSKGYVFEILSPCVVLVFEILRRM